MPDGLSLSRRYHDEVVAPTLLARWPGLPYAAARLGSGSDVLGLDDDSSRDHDWGLRLNVMVGPDLVGPVDEHLETSLPASFEGYPTRFPVTWDPCVASRVQVQTPEAFALSRLGLSLDAPLSALDWLSLTGQSLLEVTSGAVFCDRVGTLTSIRRRLAWYPDDVWLYVVAADWSRLAQELPLVGRTGSRGDEVGSRVVAGRLVATLLHLGFLLERSWPPYPKWLGTRFSALPAASAALPALEAALEAGSWEERQRSLGAAVEVLHGLQRTVGLPTGPAALVPFYARPFLGVSGDVVPLLLGAVTDEVVRRLPVGVGSVEQWVESVDVLADPTRRRLAGRVWAGALEGV